MAASPSPASPTTAISASSSSSRRKPWRTRVWSSTSRTEILLEFIVRCRWPAEPSEVHSIASRRLRAGLGHSPRHAKPHQGPALSGLQKFNGTVDQLCALSHGDESNPLADVSRCKSGTAIFNFEFEE